MNIGAKVLVACVLFSGGAATAQDCPIVLPEFFESEDIVVVAPHDPALASDAALSDAVALLGEECTVESAASWIEASALPPIARERLLVAVAERAAASGDTAELDALAALGAMQPEAVYEHPGCRRPESHAWFDFAEEARQAICSIRFHEGEVAYASEPWSSRSDGARLAGLMSSGAHSEKVAGFFSAALRSTAVPGKFVDARAMERIVAPLPQAPGMPPDAARDAALVREADRAGRADILAVMAAHMALPAAAEAVRAFDRARGDSTAHELMALWRDGTESAVLAALDQRDDVDGVRAYLTELLGDERLGADAARALVRISASRAGNEALGILGSEEAAPAARRRAVLMLMEDTVPGGRDALSGWVSSKSAESEPAMREEVVRWLAR